MTWRLVSSPLREINWPTAMRALRCTSSLQRGKFPYFWSVQDQFQVGSLFFRAFFTWVSKVNRFPALRANYMYLLRVLIGSLGCLCPLWLARVITLVLVLRHSIENCSNPKSKKALARQKFPSPPNIFFKGTSIVNSFCYNVTHTSLLSQLVKFLSSLCRFVSVRNEVWGFIIVFFFIFFRSKPE